MRIAQYLSLLCLSCPSIGYAADPQEAFDGMYHYKRGEFSKAIPKFEAEERSLQKQIKELAWAPRQKNKDRISKAEQELKELHEERVAKAKQNLKECQKLLAESKAAVALTNRNPKQLQEALEALYEADQNYKTGNCSHKKRVAIASDDFGTTIFCAYYLKRVNERMIDKRDIPFVLHLKGRQQKLKKLLSNSNVADTITTGDFKPDEDVLVAPSLAWIDTKHLFEEHEPYLNPGIEAITYWGKRVDKNKFNVMVAWAPAVKERTLPIRELLAAILQDDNAHVYLSSPTKIITKSTFDALTPEERQKQADNWVPDELYAQWEDRITIVKEKHGPFVDSTALARLGIPYIGCGTALLHIQGHVKNGKAAVILPEREDGLSNSYWRMGECDKAALHGNGHQVPGHSEHIRLFECKPTKENIMRVVELVKQWQSKTDQ